MVRQSAKIGSIALIFIAASIAFGIDMQGENVKNVTDQIMSGDLYLTGDEKSVFWYNSTSFYALKASGSLAADYSLVWPPDIGSTGQQLTVTVSGNTGIMTWTHPGGGTGGGDIDEVGDATSGSAFTADGYGNSLWFEGSTADGVETILTAVDPTTSDKTITLPNATGYTVLDGTVCTDIEGTGLSITTSTLNWAAPADSVALTTNTTGNYVASITNGAGISGGDGGSEGATLTLVATLGTTIDNTEITDGTIIAADLNLTDITLADFTDDLGADPGHTHTGASLSGVDISDDTNLAGGTNITLSGDTLNVDDAFLINNGDDTTSGGLKIGDHLIVNEDGTAQEHLSLKGKVSPGPLGGSITWYEDDTTIVGYTFANSNGRFVFDSTAQSASTDDGSAYVEFNSGDASFSGNVLAGDSLTVNADNNSSAPLSLEGYTNSGANRGGSIKWYDNATVPIGYTFANGFNQFVWDNAAQASDLDTGVAWVDFDNGNASFGALTIGGKLTGGANEIEGSNFDINGGAIDNTIIGGTTEAAGTFSDLTLIGSASVHLWIENTGAVGGAGFRLKEDTDSGTGGDWVCKVQPTQTFEIKDIKKNATRYSIDTSGNHDFKGGRILAGTGSPATPGWSFTDYPDAGMTFSPVISDTLEFAVEGAKRFEITATGITALVPLDLGSNALTTTGKLTGNEVEINGALNHDGATAGFYSTAPIVKPTGVAVSAAGIHAALVSLGLIAG